MEQRLAFRWSPDPHTWRSNVEGAKAPAQDMPGHVRPSIYLKRLGVSSTGTVRMPIGVN